MGIQQLLLLLLAGWILPKIKPQMLFPTLLKSQDPISCPPAGNHIIPTFPEGMAKSQGGSLWEGPDSVGCWWLEENLML